MKPDNLLIAVLVGVLVNVFAVLLVYVGMTHERGNIMDYGGFTAPWSETKWTCEVKK